MSELSISDRNFLSYSCERKCCFQEFTLPRAVTAGTNITSAVMLPNILGIEKEAFFRMRTDSEEGGRKIAASKLKTCS